MELRDLLERSPGGPFGCEVVTRAADAAHRLRSGRYTGTILDIKTLADGWRGLTLVCEANPRTPVLVLTQQADDELAAEVVRHGGQDVLLRGQLTADRVEFAIACAVERAHTLVELRDLSLTDPLTGLYNRRGFLLLAETHRRMLGRTGSQSLLLFADVDRLKAINDQFGHAAGDDAIRLAASALRASLRESDIVSRFGGDEFAALAHDVASGARSVVLRRVESALAQHHRGSGLPFEVSLSVGVASLDPGLDLDAVMARADRALYRSKRRRRTR